MTTSSQLHDELTISNLLYDLTRDMSNPSTAQIQEFESFLNLMKTKIINFDQLNDVMQLQALEQIHLFDDLLQQFEEFLTSSDETLYTRSHFLIFLKLYTFSLFYDDDGEGRNPMDYFIEMMAEKKVKINFLIIKFSERTDPRFWIRNCKTFLGLETKMHLAQFYLPDPTILSDRYLVVRVSRPELLRRSCNIIESADPEDLRKGLHVIYDEEPGNGDGVFRDWLFDVCRGLFDLRNGLFIPNLDDCTQLRPNPVSGLFNNNHLSYFKFCGRIVAICFMNKVHVGVRFDRSFFLQLARSEITLEDVKQIDAELYKHWKSIVDMSAEEVDSLHLTFTYDYVLFEETICVDLCPAGSDVVVNLENRDEYIDTLVQHVFVHSMNEQIEAFRNGFNDVAGEIFFKSQDMDVLNGMLFGSDVPLSVVEWKKNTDLIGFKEDDEVIVWFWQSINAMTEKHKVTILKFWTSITCLPVGGFAGLNKRFQLCKVRDANRYPHSQTCLLQLALPTYHTFEEMNDRLLVIITNSETMAFGLE